ncbi:MAG: hypothetical protein V5A68_04895 [Candidatus Thermoplasmatota archaeon]
MKHSFLGNLWKETVTWYLETYNFDWSNANQDCWIDTQVHSTWVLFGDHSLKVGRY